MSKKTVSGEKVPRRLSVKDVQENEVKQPYIKETAHLPVLSILANPYPMLGEHYAIQLFYKSLERRNPNFVCSYARLDNDNETAHLTIDDTKYQVNIRTGVIRIEN